MTPPDPRRSTASAPAQRPAEGPPARGGDRRDTWRGIDQSMLMTTELMAAVLTWGGIGVLVDRWLHTTPWLMGVGVFLGFGAGLYLIWLRALRQEAGSQAGTPPGPAPRREAEMGDRSA